jgi:hypothetical protein
MNENLKKFLVSPFLEKVCDLVLCIQYVGQGFRVVVIKVYRLFCGVAYLHVLLYVVLHRSPRHVYLYAWAENEDTTEAVAIDVEYHVLEEHRLTRS